MTKGTKHLLIALGVVGGGVVIYKMGGFYYGAYILQAIKQRLLPQSSLLGTKVVLAPMPVTK